MCRQLVAWARGRSRTNYEHSPNIRIPTGLRRSRWQRGSIEIAFEELIRLMVDERLLEKPFGPIAR